MTYSLPALLAASLCFGPINIFCIPYAQSLGVDMKLYGQAVALTYFISLTLAYLLDGGPVSSLTHGDRRIDRLRVGYGLGVGLRSQCQNLFDCMGVAWRPLGLR